MVDPVGRALGSEQFPADAAGYAALLAWMHRFGTIKVIGVEVTGAYGAGLARYLREQGVELAEVDRPDRKTRRFQGKSNPIDAIQAAKAALSADRTGTPKQRDGRVEALRCLWITRRSAIGQRGDAQRQMKALIVTAPDDLRHHLRRLPIKALIAACAALQPDPGLAGDPTTATQLALRSLARRHQQLLVTAGENHGRLGSEAAFAMLCGVAAIPASSGKTTRHRLNRGGDRQANAALYPIALVRLRWDRRTRAHMERRTRDGLSKKEITRCLKRYIARELYQVIVKNERDLAA